jgi:hypothetical protein
MSLTDSAGGRDYNMKLSKDRADAEMKALVGKYGVAASLPLSGSWCRAVSADDIQPDGNRSGIEPTG